MGLQQIRCEGQQARAAEEVTQKRVPYKRRKYLVHPSVQGTYIAFSIIPAILASLFCTFMLIRGGEQVLRTAEQAPLVPTYTMRQTVLALEREGYTKNTAPRVENLKRDLDTLTKTMEGTYQETLHRWNIIRNQVLMVLFFSLFLVALLALVFSHRVAGPLFRIGKCVDLFAQGKDSGPIRLRKHDHYKDLATSLERLRQRLCRKGFLVQKNEPSS